jgi:hypothetical protein
MTIGARYGEWPECERDSAVSLSCRGQNLIRHKGSPSAGWGSSREADESIKVPACAEKARRPVNRRSRFGVTVWDQCPGILKVESMRECIAHVARLRDPEIYQRYARRQADDSPRWALLDGRASERFLQMLKELRRNEFTPWECLSP